MDREIFMNQMNSDNLKHYDDKERLDVISRSVISNAGDGNPLGHRNLIIVTEELAELAKEVTKELRGKGDKVSITEELADVALGIDSVKYICNIKDEDLQKAIDIKLKRLDDIISKGKKYL